MDNVNEAVVAPLILPTALVIVTPFFFHKKTKFPDPVPVTVTEKVTLSPAQTDCDWGWAVILGTAETFAISDFKVNRIEFEIIWLKARWMLSLLLNSIFSLEKDRVLTNKHNDIRTDWNLWGFFILFSNLFQ